MQGVSPGVIFYEVMRRGAFRLGFGMSAGGLPVLAAPAGGLDDLLASAGIGHDALVNLASEDPWRSRSRHCSARIRSP